MLGAWGVSYISYLPQFSVQSISVKGAKEVSAELLHSYTESKLYGDTHPFLSPINIFLYPRAALEEAVRAYFPRIKSVRISRDSLLATALVVEVEEREMYARWCMDEHSDFTAEAVESCYLLDTDGLIFAPADSPPSGFSTPYTFRGALASTSTPVGQVYLPGRFSGVVALLERLGQAGFSPLLIAIKDQQDFTIKLARGFTLRTSFGADVNALVKNLELVLSSEALRGRESQLEYVDLRFGNRVYYKLVNSEQKTVNSTE